ncbi:MAG: aldo/keto reductase [Flavobacteriaceae bacterium]|nr:aldo/keto reductase [Muriicola sp.]NNC61750.1 aldo/keto reductase [Eudoraea sp.]NNK19919.1 aldo/keto reductase [Flavobacteriaceae bacterium]NNL39129.1 aldo/keto reductase [Flavobacteriaceae bacterium]
MKSTNKFSRIIAGTMTWGSWGKQLSKSEMVSLMNHCLKAGITSFDHADIYGGYGNEEEFGNAFAESGIARKDIQLISKCGIQYMCDARDNKVKHYNYATDYIIWSAERSLEKLTTEYLDLFLLHRPSPLMDPEPVAKAIEQLLSSGKIRSFGVSNFTPSQIAMLETAIPVQANQVECSLTADGVMYDGTLDDCISRKRMAMAWSPLGSYFREDNEKTKRIREVLLPMKKKYNASEDQLILAWLMKHPAHIHPVVGTSNANRLEDSMKAVNVEMELEDWFLLLEASQGHKVP